MLRRLGRHIRQNAVAWLALFVALGGNRRLRREHDQPPATSSTTKSAVARRSRRHARLRRPRRAGPRAGFGRAARRSRTSSLSGTEILNSSLGGADIAPSSLTGSDVQDNSLTGADINEANLVLPPTTTATFAGQGNVPVGNVFNKIIGKTVPAGSYAVTSATANVDGVTGPVLRTTFCELRNPSGTAIGFARDGRVPPSTAQQIASLSMNGGAQAPAGGGEISLWCRYTGGATELVGDGSIMIVRVDGFF